MRLIVAAILWLLLGAACDGGTVEYVKKHWHPSVSPSHFLHLGFLQAYFFGLPFCFASGVMIETAMLRRELTTAEAHTMLGSCILPILGGMIVKDFFDRNPQYNIPGQTRRLEFGVSGMEVK